MSTISSGKIQSNNLKLYYDFLNKRSYSTNLVNYSNWTIGTGSIATSS